MTSLPDDARQPKVVTVDDHDTLPQVLDRIRAASGNAVTLVVPDHCPILLTATEYRTLRDAAERSGHSLTLQTDDPLRVQLGAMFGLVERVAPAAGDDSSPDSPTDPVPAYREWRIARQNHERRARTPVEDDPIATSRRRRTELYEPGVTIGEREDPGANAGLSVDATHVALSYLNEDAGSRRIWLIGRIVAIAVVLALIVGISSCYFMPVTTITATLQQGQVSTTLLYSVTRPGASGPGDAAFTVEATNASANVPFTIEAPATGSATVPETQATGAVVLRNASTEAVTVPAGTTLTTVQGISFTTDSEVETPAGSPDGSVIGEITVGVTAVDAGSGGNLGIGVLSGKVPDLPVYFSNRESAITGGSDREVATVTQADLDRLQTAVDGDLRRYVAAAWNVMLPTGQSILVPSVETGTPRYTIQQQVGDLSETVTLTGTVSATALQFDQGLINVRAREYYTDELTSQVPVGYEIVPGTLALAEPVLVAESPNSVEFTMTGSATVVAQFDTAAQENLTRDLAGASQEKAASMLANVPAFASWSIDRSPGWWPGGLAHATSRTTLVIERVAPTAEATPAAPPMGTPTPVGARD